MTVPPTRIQGIDTAAIKLLWLAIRNIEDKRARQRAKEKGLPGNQRKAPGKLVEGQTVTGWKAAYGALAVAYPDRLNTCLLYTSPSPRDRS